MTAPRLQLTHPLPAPVVHVGFSIPQSKSHVLAGVQDAYWSDDDAEDPECPLCMDELDISDINFKPCVCGYQICRFCWHHIRENLNGRCPACRREYTDDAVEFKPIPKEDHKRLTQQKKQRERERKELDNMGRRHLANYRVVQRNVVYVVGIGPMFAKEELIPTLRSHEYFGQYGKISKIVIVKRTPSGGAPVVGLYITYHRREDAARCIAAVDGSPSPGSASRSDVMRASYGTTKYCMAFLRGGTCSDNSCMNLHEWGDEKDCFTKEDLTTLKHTMKATESKSRPGEKGSEGLPKAASWAQSWTQKGPSQSSSHGTNSSASTSTRSTRRLAGNPRPARTGHVSTSSGESRPSGARSERTKTNTKTPSQASSSRPGTPAPSGLPARPATPPEVKALRRKESTPPEPSISPAPSTNAASDVGSLDIPLASPDIPLSAALSPTLPSAPAVPPGIPIVPPGLSVPPGLPAPNRLAKSDGPVSQTPILAAQTTYQMSNAARALLDDMQTRREAAPLPVSSSVFPDLDHLLQALSGADDGGGFSFNLDPSLAAKNAEDNQPLPEMEAVVNLPFQGTYLDAFPALRGPPGLPPINPPPLPYGRPIFDASTMSASPAPSGDPPSTSSSYTGSFDPFADANDDIPSFSSSARRPQLSMPDDEGRKVSRFGFARGRQGSTAASSPLHASSPINSNDTHSFFNSNDMPHPQDLAKHFWMPPAGSYGFPSSSSASPHVLHAQAAVPQPSGRFQPFDNNAIENHLRDFVQSSQQRADMKQHGLGRQQQFHDPAIMSAKFSAPMADNGYMQSPPPSTLPPQLSYGPPPGLVSTMLQPTNHNVSNMMEANAPASTSPVLSPSDFPALTASPIESSPVDNKPVPDEISPVPVVPSAKLDKKAAKKAAAAEKAAERRKQAEEKAAVKAAEKARQKAVEREQAAALKVQQEKDDADREQEQREKQRAEKEKAEKERIEKEKVEKEKDLADKLKAARLKEKMDKALKAEKSKVDSAAAIDVTKGASKKAGKQIEARSSVAPRSSNVSTTSLPRQTQLQAISPAEPTQVPLLSKKPKKTKPAAKPVIKVPKDEDSAADVASSHSSIVQSESTYIPLNRGGLLDTSASNSRAQSVDRDSRQPVSLKELLEEICVMSPYLDLPDHPFFDTSKINPAAKMPLEYGPLVHALSALSVGGSSFTNNMPSGSIDNAVSSFQQLLETLTQTISDLLRLLPRTTWDDSSSFDGVLRDMLKGDDFLDEGGDDGTTGKDDEVAALTLALERRARWMEVQLSKLEELHRDINNAAVRAVLSFNDSGWDRHAALPRSGNSLKRFDSIGLVHENGTSRPMTADELQEKLKVAEEAAIFADTELRESMEKMQKIRPEDHDIF
ncbi:transcriptional repressor proteinral negative regulator of transcription subunit 4 [Pleurotus ostreatus]|uniref:Transcriptional repressor proteinral negative regulator of transcription subunit 4 n=1 Tax=Pleurotus ostreatus TaxID=5322 RepID=A0A8H7A346_PLEOS|nr:transcriptional repressor general negative regulator of transcription subunit 4 [Pleurotus ostreatus]KAF7441103.1 transcriptional repressor proteinral negative regulator of transcription subunit 4 [Pleurotus ostreatus]KAJ8699413.1 transcriptional repressor general negative regulator of transcription subunit 4 [Pleurotus ostreatus]